MLAIVGVLEGQGSSEQQLRIERTQAERDLSRLVDVLEIKPGTTAADAGACYGAMTVVLGEWLGSGRLFATDIGALQLQVTRDYVMRESLSQRHRER